MKILHISDTHWTPSIVTSAPFEGVDVIVLSGDMMSNRGRIHGAGIIPALEVEYQTAWMQEQARSWAPLFGKTPVVYVDGNHDFIDIGDALRAEGCNMHHITVETPCVEVCGLRFAGFREIPWIAGEWMGECHDLQEPVERAFACNPDILVTHGPAGGILDGPYGYGNRMLTVMLTYGTHQVRAHLFGHAHAGQGVVREMGILFSNAAETRRILEV